MGRLFFLFLLALSSACSKPPELLRQEHPFGYSIPLPPTYNSTTFHDVGSDSTGTVTYLQGENPALTSLSVWVQPRNQSMEDYFPLISRIPRNWEVEQLSEIRDFDVQNSSGGWREQTRYRMELFPGDTLAFIRDLWVIGHGDYFYSFFWSLSADKEAELLERVRPSMEAVRFNERP